MDLVPTKQFFDWLSTTEVAPDARYQEPRCLVYFPYRDFDRFWQVPNRASAVPNFVETLLDGMDDWSACYVWPRGGRWASDSDDAPIGDRVRGLVLTGAGVPAGFEGAVRFTAAEVDRLVA